MDLHNISSNELMVFGDYNNDLEMLALADYSFAMENAIQMSKKLLTIARKATMILV